MSAFENPSPDYTTGVDVGSFNSQDEFVGYGTAFNNPDRFKLQLDERIHLINPTAAPLYSWMSAVNKQPIGGFNFSWMEDELFTHRDLRAKVKYYHAEQIVTLRILKGGDWQAFEAAASGDAWHDDRPLTHIIVKAVGSSDQFAVILNQPALYKGPGNRPYEYTAGNTVDLMSEIVIYDANTSQIGGDYSECRAIPSDGTHTYGLGKEFAIGTWDDAGSADFETDVYVQTITPNDYLGGFAQGSGLPNESRKRSRTFSNYTQIFKTPFSLAGTLQSTEMHGPNELARLRLRKAIEHKIDIERAVLFQGGGELNLDWGVLPVTGASNPKTRFKGLGVGKGKAQAGWITTKNGEWNTDLQFSAAANDVQAINDLCAAVFDDTVDNPSSTKVVFASQKWLLTLSNLSMKQSGGQWVFGVVDQKSGSLGGMPIKTLMSPVGNLRFVHMPLFRGIYEDYAMVLDMSNIKVRPYKNRDTTLVSDAAGRDIDGRLDYFQTEVGFECHHESTHAILKLTA